MNQAQLYSKYHDVQKCDAIYVIENYIRLIKWRTNDNILDIGSGDGDVLMKHLLPEVPNDIAKVVGIDISEEMVDFSKKTHKDPRIRFELMDVSTKRVPVDLLEDFDHAFSFYCLHWVVDQRQAMKNIFNMLKPGGDMLLTFLVTSPVFEVYENMAKSPKWAPYMKNLNNYLSPYQHSKDPAEDLDKILKEEGFVSRQCRVENRSYVFPNFSTLRNSITAINPFVEKLPSSEVQEYIQDYIEEIKKLKSVTIENCNNNNNNEKIYVTNKIFIVYSSKPLL